MLTLSRRRKAQVLLQCLGLTAFLLLLSYFSMTPKQQVFAKDEIRGHSRRLSSAIADHCEGTLYPELCASTVAAIPSLHTKTLPEIICHAINSTESAVHGSVNNASDYLHRGHRRIDPRQKLALNDCLELFDQTLDDLQDAYASLASKGENARVEDVQTVLSAAITNQYTCLDGFAYVTGGGYRTAIERRLYHVAHLVSNSLAMLKRVQRRRSHHPRREVFEGYGHVDAGGFPRWVRAKDRRLLQVAANATQPNLVVAKDGSGNFTTISDAVAAAPNNSATRFVIYIKAGAYFENVDVGKSKTNLVFIGDGIGNTVVKASRNVVDGWTTFRSATISVVANGFLMRDMTIENSAGPSKHQAVALRVGADFSVFYKCSFVGYQDTLYVHSLRQFYRECNIYGTIDFIFGNAAVVFQKCNLYARVPMSNQQNIFTAQGREDPNQNTGISIQNCKVTAAADLLAVQSNFSTYLGRPWKQYSRTVYMQSLLDSLISPKGWLEWNGTFALDTLYYGEYMNRGPGSNTANRVDWLGYHVITSAEVASNFTVGSFIQGDEWLGTSMVPYSVGLN